MLIAGAHWPFEANHVNLHVWEQILCARAHVYINDQSVKRPSHGKLKLANSFWQTQVGVCERTKTGGKHVCKLLASNRNMFADCFYAVHTPTWVCQHEFANLSLPCECRLRASENQRTFWNLGTSLAPISFPDLFVHKHEPGIFIGSSGFILISLLSVSTKPSSLIEPVSLFRRTPIEETKGVSEECLLQRLWRDEPAKPEWPVLRSALAGWIPVQRTR